MANKIIPDNGSFQFFARQPIDSDGNQTTRAIQIIGWAVDDENLKAKPVVFPALKDKEILVFKCFSGAYQELE